MKKLAFAALAAVLLLTGCAAGAPGGINNLPESTGSVLDTDKSPPGEAPADNTHESYEQENPKQENPAQENPTSDNVGEGLNAREITEAMGLGWNLGNQLEASIGGTPGETAWGNPVISEELFRAIKQAGFSTVRIPVSYLNKIGDGPDYKIDGAWLDRVREVVDYALRQDLFVIINIHGDGYYTVDGAWLKCAENADKQREITEKFAAVWGQIAECFKDYDERLIFESMNEVFDNTYGAPNPDYYKNINEYNCVFVDAVRKTGAVNAKRWLLIPGWNTNIEYTAGDYGFAIPKDSLCEVDENRLMISVHFYDPYNFTLDENPSTATTEWGKNAVKNYDGWGQEDYVDLMTGKLKDAFVSRGFPVVIGEFGVANKSHLNADFGEFRNYWAEYLIKAAKKNGCVPVYWDNGWNGDFGLAIIDRYTLGVTQPELLDAMIGAINS